MVNFRVCVPGVYISAFMIAYSGYIRSWGGLWFNDRVFTMAAPEFIYNEIVKMDGLVSIL